MCLILENQAYATAMQEAHGRSKSSQSRGQKLPRKGLRELMANISVETVSLYFRERQPQGLPEGN